MIANTIPCPICPRLFPQLLRLLVFLAPQPAPRSPSRPAISLTKFPFRLDPLLCQAAPDNADGNLRFQGGRQADLHMPRINPFAQRLTDHLEACVDLLVFGLRGLPPPCLAPPLLALPGPLLDALVNTAATEGCFGSPKAPFSLRYTRGHISL